MDAVDVAIVGGGAAGIAAARTLSDLGRKVLIIEAMPRLGGRAHTIVIEDMPLDLGCGWMHSAGRNPLAALAAAQGVQIDRSEAAWGDQLGDLHFPAAAQHEAWNAYQAFCRRLADDPPASDRASDALADDRWRPFIDGLSSFINGVETDRLSAADFTAYDRAATDSNWRLPTGYGAFIAGLADGIPAALSTSVSAIDDGGSDVAIETGGGSVHAGAAIVTVSTSVLAAGAIRFGGHVDAHLHAASRLPLGLADKVLLAMDDPGALPPESHLLGHFDRAGTGSYYLRPFGRPVIECFLGGREARALEDDRAAITFAIEELKALLGSGFVRRLRPLVATRWGHEPTILGSYSHALPGSAGERAMLARPASERLCFAGEACSAQDFSTAHGAWDSGLAAARWAHAALGS